ncbi:MAG TPA: hypothetical protein DD376_02465 [Sutterella sp.]|nr:hypothetical protein [Sutterella sp.]
MTRTCLRAPPSDSIVRALDKRARLTPTNFSIRFIAMTPCRQCFLALLFTSVATVSLASTFWSVRGPDSGENGQTMVAYVRDDLAGEQTLATIFEDGSIPFKGLYVGKTHRFEAGLNKNGLFVGQISAASVSRNERLSLFSKRFKSSEGWFGGEWLVRNCSSVSQALEQPRVFSGYPMIYVLADKYETAVVECLTDGRLITKRINNGFVTHTNHFLFPEAVGANGKVPISSIARLDRINALLDTQPKPFRLGQFLAFATDSSAGPDLSLFRTGSKLRSPKTTCIWLLTFPQKGKTLSYLRFLNETTWETTREEFPASSPVHTIKPLIPIPITEPAKEAVVPESNLTPVTSKEVSAS